ncbi:hypothetical protein ACFL30_00795 [Candidatus Latescibacterota bacterium]
MTYGMQRVKPKSLRRSSKVRIYLMVVTITVFLLFYLSAHVLILSLKETVMERQTDRTYVENEIKNLEGEIAHLRKGSRIVSIARDQLGMEVHQGAPEKLF